MSTTIGRTAEQTAVAYLEQAGFKVLAQNWRTRWCEIDIVAHKNDAVYFVEAKYRSRNAWGGGLDYITPSKLRQMKFAAEFWIAKHKAVSTYRLGAIELTGIPPRVTQWLNDIT